MQSLSFVLLALAASLAHGQNPRIVRDIYSVPNGARPLHPRDFVEASGVYFFVAYGDERVSTGWELYATTGRPGSTKLVADIVRGSGSSNPQHLTAFGNRLAFTADDGIHGRELWLIDDVTKPEPFMVDIRPGRLGSAPSDFALAYNGNLLFAADNGDVGRELWSSDGTLTGTSLFIDLVAGSKGSDPSDLAYSSTMRETWFAATTQGLRRAWKTDGTLARTFLVAPVMAPPSGFRPFGDRMFWAADRTVFYSDGISVVDLFRVGQLRRVTDAFLTADYPDNGSELLVETRGTARCGALLSLVGTDPGGTLGSFSCLDPNLAQSARVGNRVVYECNDYPNSQSAGHELWVYPSPKLIKDIAPGAVGSHPRDFVSVGSNAYFTAWDPVNGRELWITNGRSGSGTKLVANLAPGSRSGVSTKGIAIGTDLLFSGNGRLRRTDGTAIGTREVEQSTPDNPDSSPDWFAATENAAYFAATDNSAGVSRLWISRGTPATTEALTSNGNPKFICAIGDKAYFVASDKLWESDGTKNGTVAKRTGTYEHLTAIGDELVYIQPSPFRLWIWDRVAAPVLLLTDNAAPSWIPNFAPVGSGGSFLFAGAGNTELWISDGTVAGTQELGDLNSSSDSDPRWMTAFGNRVVFSADDGANGRELWISDGTAAGTALLKDIAAGASSSDPGSFAVQGDTLYFFANGDELWKSDGTAAGTVMIKDLATPASNPGALTAVGTRHLMFRAEDTANGVELWISDGTSAGTRLAADVNRGALLDGLYPTQAELARYRWSFAVLGEKVFFAGKNSFSGAEPWVWDNGATAWTGGPGCGTATRVPVLSATDPVLGQTQQVTSRNVRSGSFATLVLGFDGTSVMAPGCRLWLHPWRPWLLLDAWVQASGDRLTQLAIPNDHALEGTRLSMQTIVAPTDATNGFDLSNSVRGVLGR